MVLISQAFVNFTNNFRLVRNTQLAFVCASLGVLLIITAYLAWKLKKLSAGSASVEKAARHMFRWMVPNTLCLICYLAFFILLCNDDENVYFQYNYKLLGDYGTGYFGVVAALCQVGVFLTKPSSSSS